MLSLDLWDDDYMYRIRRGRRVVYILILDMDIVPRDVRTDGYWVVSILQKLPVWDEYWQTLTINKPNNASRYELDQFPPHSVSLHESCLQLPNFNIVDLKYRDRISDRVSQVAINERNLVLKIARFQFETASIRNEIEIYSYLVQKGFMLGPDIVGYVHEEEGDRIIGFLLEDLPGRYPSIDDLDLCQATIQELHAIGILHGDLNKYNFLISGMTAKIIDYEASTHITKDSYEASNEMQQPTTRLLDDSGIGRKFNR